MKTIGTFNQMNHNFTVRVQKTESNSNYNQFCHVFHENEKMPIIGYSIKDDMVKSDIMERAKESIGQLQAEELAKDITNHCRPATAEEKWPELDSIATKLFENVVNKINVIQPGRNIETECHYSRQCILEMVIAKLEKCV